MRKEKAVIYLDEDEIIVLKQVAKKNDMSVSQFLRIAVREYLKNG
jgi:hypothetical protein